MIARLDETVDHVLVHTGQNHDYTLNQIFFEDLGIGSRITCSRWTPPPSAGYSGKP